MTKETVQRSMVKNRRRGLDFIPEMPIFTAWRAGSLERINLLSSGEYSFFGVCFSSVGRNTSFEPSS